MEIQFVGAAREVTGSCHLVRAGRATVLVDCGLIQGRVVDEARNRDAFPFDPSRIDAVVLSHAHLDHSGRLPLLVKAGYKGPIYTQRATRDLCRIMLKDAAHLNEKDIEWENRKRERKGLKLLEALYTTSEADAALKQFKVLDYGVRRRVAPGVEVCLRDAGHILGSAIVEMWLKEGEAQRKLVFSGDLGNRGVPILRDPETIKEADLVIMESTYGERLHRDWRATLDELRDVIGMAQRNKGNILIPSFAVGRAQELLYLFGVHSADWGLRDWQIFLDSPMAIRATEVYTKHHDLYDPEAISWRGTNGRPFDLPNLHYSQTAAQSMAINRIQAGAIIIAGSGMCTGGRIKHHLKHQLWRAHTHVIMVGFQARGTPGRALVDGASHIRLWGETIRVAATVHTIGGLSAHADQAGLIAWYRHFEQRPAVALVHGEAAAMDGLAAKLREEERIEVHTPEPGMRIDLLH